MVTPIFNGAHHVKGANFETWNVGPHELFRDKQSVLLNIFCFLVCRLIIIVNFKLLILICLFSDLFQQGKRNFLRMLPLVIKLPTSVRSVLIPQDINIEQGSFIYHSIHWKWELNYILEIWMFSGLKRKQKAGYRPKVLPLFQFSFCVKEDQVLFVSIFAACQRYLKSIIAFSIDFEITCWCIFHLSLFVSLRLVLFQL